MEVAPNYSDPVISSLTGVTETLLITLAARVLAPWENPDLKFEDPVAEYVARTIALDINRFKSDRKTMRGAVSRAIWFDKVVFRLLTAHPGATCISFGSGLDVRQSRLAGVEYSSWIDVELPDVHDLRRRFVPQKWRREEVVSEVAHPVSWLESVSATSGQPIIFFAEGVFLYLDRDTIVSLLSALINLGKINNSKVFIVIDLISPILARLSRKNTSVRSTGANFTIGVNTPDQVTSMFPELNILESTDLMDVLGVSAALFRRLYQAATWGKLPYSGCCFST
ncbi:class I SAM-dependent methyltransferase [Gluconobacter thailandicus]|uniref:Class I SAM-dependent methyltransferase n=1 Tax=Gluconobacter thailandicus TaxID=257438 RepID=A0AAP9EUS9_GLUTH|nr:class I SAM-dependent methyltransferase [Gluconobacter thailandicus]QEH97778.1 hypothetical protein FXF46_15885 [Gluconobacter thailandicus]